MLNVAQSMKKCSSSDNFPTTRSLLRSFLNKSTTTFRHFAAVVKGNSRMRFYDATSWSYVNFDDPLFINIDFRNQTH